jgi:hypothetical protein
MSALEELQDKENWSNWYQWLGARSLQLEIVPELVVDFAALRAERDGLAAELAEAIEILSNIDRRGKYFTRINKLIDNYTHHTLTAEQPTIGTPYQSDQKLPDGA